MNKILSGCFVLFVCCANAMIPEGGSLDRTPYRSPYMPYPFGPFSHMPRTPGSSSDAAQEAPTRRGLSPFSGVPHTLSGSGDAQEAPTRHGLRSFSGVPYTLGANSDVQEALRKEGFMLDELPERLGERADLGDPVVAAAVLEKLCPVSTPVILRLLKSLCPNRVSFLRGEFAAREFDDCVTSYIGMLEQIVEHSVELRNGVVDIVLEWAVSLDSDHRGKLDSLLEALRQPVDKSRFQVAGDDPLSQRIATMRTPWSNGEKTLNNKFVIDKIEQEIADLRRLSPEAKAAKDICSDATLFKCLSDVFAVAANRLPICWLTPIVKRLGEKDAVEMLKRSCPVTRDFAVNILAIYSSYVEFLQNTTDRSASYKNYRLDAELPPQGVIFQPGGTIAYSRQCRVADRCSIS